VSSLDLLDKLLGKTAEYLGDELLVLVKRCHVNLDAIIQAAWRKAGGNSIHPAL